VPGSEPVRTRATDGSRTWIHLPAIWNRTQSMCGIFCAAARSDGAGFSDGSALASFGKSPLEPFTFMLVEPACFGQSARPAMFAAYDHDPGACSPSGLHASLKTRKGALMKRLINAIISIAAMTLMLASVPLGGATAQGDTVNCPPPPPAGHPNIFMRTVQCSNLNRGTGSTGSAQQPIIENKQPPVGDDGTKSLPK
jgi:hypothetical protein